MEWRARGTLLWSRALMAGGISFALGVVGHVGADGLLPGPVTLVVLAGLSVVLAAVVLARPASYLRMVGLVLGLQTLTHLFLSVTAGHRGDPASAAGPASVARAASGTGQLPTVDGRRVGSLLDAYAAQAGHPALSPTLPVGHLLNDISAHLPMVIAHFVASILLGVWLAVGERAVFGLMTFLGHRVLMVRLGLQPIATPTRRRRIPAVHRDRPRRTALLLLADPRRGPPLLRAL